jgi:hypothetical protein
MLMRGQAHHHKCTHQCNASFQGQKRRSGRHQAAIYASAGRQKNREMSVAEEKGEPSLQQVRLLLLLLRLRVLQGR